MRAADASHDSVLQIMRGIWSARALYAAAELQLADRIAAGVSSVRELAELTATHAPSLYRLLRALAAQGFFVESERGCFALTALGETLREDAPGKARAAVLTLGGAWQWKAWDNLLYSLRTGRPAMQQVFGKDLFEYLSAKTDDRKAFNDAMIAIHGEDGPAAVAAYDFSPFRHILDVGGGTGSLLAAILGAQPHSRGVLFECAEAIREAQRLFEDQGLHGRCETVVGDFFQEVPTGHDCYLLAHVLHDWQNEEARLILGNCRRAMSKQARLLVLEAIVPDDNAYHPAKMMDLLMLTVTGGAERTVEQFSSLLASAGFAIKRVVPTSNGQNIIEAIPI